MSFRKSRTLIAKEAKIQQWSTVPDQTFMKAGITRAAATRLELGVSFKLVWPWDADYEKSRAQFDPAFQEYPLLVGYPEMPAHVAELLEFTGAFPTRPPITCRSGGHNTAGYSVLSGGVVIDMSLFNHVVVDPVKKLATVGPGVTFGNLNTALDRYGLHVPGGECESVCVGGYMQGGGYGFTSREFGMNCDNVVRFAMMTYDAKGAHIVHASASENPRLFWAVRGGTGNNFGVLLEVTYQLYSLGTLWGFGVKWANLDDAPAALVVMQNQFSRVGATPKLGHLPVIMVQKGDASASLGTYGLYNGTRAQGLAAIKPLLATTGAKLVFDESDTYPTLNEKLLPDPNLPSGVTSFPPEIKQSAYIATPVDLAGWTAIVRYFEKRPTDTNALFLEPYGGAVARGPASPNAFIHRDAYVDVYIDSFWFDDSGRSAAETWLDGYMQVLAPYSNGQQYQNYPRRNTPNYAEAFWGEAYPALQQVKAEYDPLNLFEFPMGIVPARGGKRPLVVHTGILRRPSFRLSTKARTVEPHFEKFKERTRARRT